MPLGLRFTVKSWTAADELFNPLHPGLEISFLGVHEAIMYGKVEIVDKLESKHIKFEMLYGLERKRSVYVIVADFIEVFLILQHLYQLDRITVLFHTVI